MEGFDLNNQEKENLRKILSHRDPSYIFNFMADYYNKQCMMIGDSRVTKSYRQAYNYCADARDDKEIL